jgi:dTDP-4-amino-4,6-dideoxygalactose transaminase
LKLDLPETEKLVNECISLPVHPSLTKDELATVASTVTEVAGLLL